jgi:hypothetical protein
MVKNTMNTFMEAHTEFPSLAMQSLGDLSNIELTQASNGLSNRFLSTSKMRI